MIERTTDVKLVQEAHNRLIPQYDFDAEWWLANDRMLAYVYDGDIALFDYDGPGQYTGHFLFTKARGRKAVELGFAMLKRLDEDYRPETVRGITPLTNLGARWVAKKLGFESIGLVDTWVGPCEIMLLRREH